MESATERPAWAPRPDAELQQPGAITPDMTSGQRLYHHSHATANHPLHCLEFRVLQRMNILRLQNKLATLKGTCSEKKQLDPADEDTMGRTLHEYAVAIQDFVYLQSLPDVSSTEASRLERELTAHFPEIANLIGRPFASKYHLVDYRRPAGHQDRTSVDPVRALLSRILPKRITYTKAEKRERIEEYVKGEPPETVSPLVDKLARFLVALVGGASLVLPMLIMSLPQNLVKSLVTVSIAVTLFAMLLSVGVRASNAETLVATATYAAVLVVFVGTST